jgi:tetratricopeptide (TPR) repeat protein
MGMLVYYLVPLMAALATDHPNVAWAAIGVLVFRRYLPDPVVWLRTFERARALESAIEANPANATACRDLARIYLERGFASRALGFVEKALARFPSDPELLFLLGKSLVEKHQWQRALEPLVGCVQDNPSLLHGEPYGLAAQALLELRRYPEALDAALRYLDLNGSSLAAYRLVAKAQQKAGDVKAAEATEVEAAKTWRMLPSYKRRGQWTERVRLAFGV